MFSCLYVSAGFLEKIAQDVGGMCPRGLSGYITEGVLRAMPFD